MFTMIDRKEVLDFDGFWTEYSLYTNGIWFVCVFGDSELYGPEEEDNWDFATESEEEAYEWFGEFDTEEVPDVEYVPELGWYE